MTLHPRIKVYIRAHRRQSRLHRWAYEVVYRDQIRVNALRLQESAEARRWLAGLPAGKMVKRRSEKKDAKIARKHKPLTPAELIEQGYVRIHSRLWDKP